MKRTPKTQPLAHLHQSRNSNNGNGSDHYAESGSVSSDKLPVLITGGAGFIGTNLSDRLLSTGQPVLIYDNLSRPGVEQNLRWLREKHGGRLSAKIADMRDIDALARGVRSVSAVFHFAAQVAVTSSLVSPANDFEVNTRGTLNLLEALRGLQNPPPLIFTSTNKVYGRLKDVELHADGVRYKPAASSGFADGIDENHRLEFYSPYGCSKGAADQYVIDYARVFGLPALVFRMSCIYGPHQIGTEDQGWLAHFLMRAMSEEPIRLYGDGMQVRDVLFVDDLVNAFLLAHANIHTLAGEAFNIGGGHQNTISLLELIDLIGEIRGIRPEVNWAEWRPGDQLYYVSDFSKFQKATGWSPNVGVREGVTRLHQWLGAVGVASNSSCVNAS